MNINFMIRNINQPTITNLCIRSMALVTLVSLRLGTNLTSISRRNTSVTPCFVFSTNSKADFNSLHESLIRQLLFDDEFVCIIWFRFVCNCAIKRCKRALVNDYIHMNCTKNRIVTNMIDTIQTIA